MSNVPGDPDLKTLYDQLCVTYHNIDDFRAKLLGLLPLATTAGILLIFDKIPNAANLTEANQLPPLVKSGLGSAAVFAVLITLGLLVYEVYGICKCHAIIKMGQRLERRMGIPGQFATRPRAIWNLLNEPFAAAVIYPAVIAVWMYVALSFTQWAAVAGIVAGICFFGGLAIVVRYGWRLGVQDAAYFHEIHDWVNSYPWQQITGGSPDAPPALPSNGAAPQPSRSALPPAPTSAEC